MPAGPARHGRADSGKQIDIPTFGYKAHLSIDKRHRFICKWDVTAKHDGRLLRLWISAILHPVSGRIVPIGQKKNETFLHKHGDQSNILYRKP
ncbi:MAG: hypothetical protein HRT36_03665 [Alphaproteobacteria bacterium]|nr:hypothetical protein [Alphaproteobacteria bacterium]